jgi:hypothetical protein
MQPVVVAVENAPQLPWNWREHLLDTRSGVTFYECLMACASTRELVSEFDKLTGTNLQRTGAPLKIMIDDATSKTNSDIEKFIQFVWETTFLRS